MDDILSEEINTILIFRWLRKYRVVLRTLSRLSACLSMNYVGGECFAGGLCLSVVGFARLIYEVSKSCKLTMQVKGKGRGNDAPPLSYSFALIPRDAMYRSRRGMANTSQTMAMDKLILPFSPSMSARLNM